MLRSLRMSSSCGVSFALGPSSKVMAMYGPLTWTSLQTVLRRGRARSGSAGAGAVTAGDAVASGSARLLRAGGGGDESDERGEEPAGSGGH